MCILLLRRKALGDKILGEVDTGGSHMRQHAKPISLAGSDLNEVRHVCALFNSDEEEYGSCCRS